MHEALQHDTSVFGNCGESFIKGHEEFIRQNNEKLLAEVRETNAGQKTSKPGTKNKKTNKSRDKRHFVCDMIAKRILEERNKIPY